MIFVEENASAPTTTSSAWRRIRTGTARIIRAGLPSNPRSYTWGRRRKRLRSFGFYQEAKGLPKRYAFFCRKTTDIFGVEVYRKSTGVLDLGKSSGNDGLDRDETNSAPIVLSPISNFDLSMW